MSPPKSWDCAPCPCSWDYLSCDSVDMCSSTDSRINAGQRHHFCLTQQHKCVHWTQSKVERLLITQEVVWLPQRVWNNQTDWSEVLDRMTSNTNQQIQTQWDLIALITSWTGWCQYCYCTVFWINATFTDLLLFLLTVNSGSCVHTSSGGSLCRAFSQNRIILLVAVRKRVMLTATQIYSSSSSFFTTGVRFYSTLLYSTLICEGLEILHLLHRCSSPEWALPASSRWLNDAAVLHPACRHYCLHAVAVYCHQEERAAAVSRVSCSRCRFFKS